MALRVEGFSWNVKKWLMSVLTITYDANVIKDRTEKKINLVVELFYLLFFFLLESHEGQESPK